VGTATGWGRIPTPPPPRLDWTVHNAAGVQPEWPGARRSAAHRSASVTARRPWERWACSPDRRGTMTEGTPGKPEYLGNVSAPLPGVCTSGSHDSRDTGKDEETRAEGCTARMGRQGSGPWREERYAGRAEVAWGGNSWGREGERGLGGSARRGCQGWPGGVGGRGVQK